MNKNLLTRWLALSLSLVLFFSAMLSSNLETRLANIAHAQDSLELDATAKMIGDEGSPPGLLTFQYPNAWEFAIDGDGYLATRTELVDDFEFENDDLLFIFTEFTYQAYDYNYAEDTDPVEYIQTVMSEDVAQGLSAVSSEELTLDSLNIIHNTYEVEELVAHVFGFYEAGNQPIIAYTVSLPEGYSLHEETVLAILATVEFDPAYDPYLEALNEFVAGVDLSNAQSFSVEGEQQAVNLTADDEYVIFAYEAEADTVVYFRIDETTAVDDNIRLSMLVLAPDNHVIDASGATSTSSSTVDGESLYATYSQIVVHFEQSGTHHVLVASTGIFTGESEPATLDFEIFYQPVIEVSATESIEVAHISGQRHLFMTEEIFDQEMTITAVTAENTGLKLEISGGCLAETTSGLGRTSFQIQEPDSTIPMSIDLYYDADFSVPGRLVFMVTEESLPREGELIPDVETTLTLTITPTE